MSSDDEISSSDDQADEESSVSTAADDGLLESEERNLPTVDDILWEATKRDDAETVKRALQNGANVSTVRSHWTPLMTASERGFDEIVGILLDAGADARCIDHRGWSALLCACRNGHLSTIQLLINYDSGLLEMTNNEGWTPLFFAVRQQHSDFVRYLLDSGANPHHVDESGQTALMIACEWGSSLDIVRLLLAAGVDVEARDKWQMTALHGAADSVDIEIMCELILQHNANMFAVDEDGDTPFDWAFNSEEQRADVVDNFLEIYGNKLIQDHGQLALHELLKVAEYSFAEDEEFHPPLNPLKIILPLGKLTLQHLCTLLHNLDPELIRNRDDAGKLPIHIACQTNTPVELLSMLAEIDSATLQIADNHSGSLPVHWCCSGVADYASVRYLVEQGGVGTLAARNHQGALALHVLCASTNPSLRVVQYLIQSFPGSVAVQTNAGHYPFMVAAGNSSASLSELYELIRANPGLVIPS